VSVSDAIVRHLVVHGRVQGVFFRASTERHAEREGVTGWVRNRPDGTVEAWLEGPAEAVEAVETWIREGGPPAGRVDDVEVLDEGAPEGHDGFRVVR
jgi:acylphosphatase